MADDQKFLTDLQSADADTRFATWRAAGEASPAVIPQVGKLCGSENPAIAKAAREALTTITHSVGKDVTGPSRAGVVKGLMELTAPAYEVPVRAHAFRLLSDIAGQESVPAIAKYLRDDDLREEVVFCLERIPGDASVKGLIAAWKDAKEEFKPRLLAAFGHRRATEGVPICVEAMRSQNKEIAVAAVKAFGRIGRKPSSSPRYPDTKGFTEWQRIDQMDAILRYADAQAEDGNAAEALRLYRSALERPEEHWQCAAIIGISKLGTLEAATVIHPKLKSENRTVRITAEKAWKAMASPAKA